MTKRELINLLESSPAPDDTLVYDCEGNEVTEVKTTSQPELSGIVYIQLE